jgi:acetyltransferase-like isoleucine patch superfamily enzyme
MDWDFHSTHPDHRNDPEYIRGAPVTIAENVWITTDCTVLKGTTIGHNSTIGVNSVVRNDIPPNSIASGNPAVVHRRRYENGRGIEPIVLNQTES